jgi:hypothetical protein
VTSGLGSVGELKIVPDLVGPASANVVATCKEISRVRTITILVRHTAPVWAGGDVVHETVFSRSAFERVVTATCSGAPSYSISARKPNRPGDDARVSSDTGTVRATLSGDATIYVRAPAPDSVTSETNMSIIVSAYDPGEVYGATSDNPGGPSIVSLLGSIRSKVRFGVFAQQIGAGEPLRFFPCMLFINKRCHESMRRDTPAMQQHTRDHTEEIECLSRRAQ